MEVRDGFIVGVFNYCDRWCERCRLTSRCQLFTDRAEDEFERDHGAIGEPRAERIARQMSEAAARWEKELGIDLEEILREAEQELNSSPDVDAMFEVALEHLELETRTRDFGDAVYNWLRQIPDDQYRATPPIQVLGHFWVFVGGKIHRALTGLKDDDADGAQSDALGSAKAALLGLEEMRTACAVLAKAHVMAPAASDDLRQRINWLIAALDATLPRARTFVRPGFDEPDALARLEAE